MRARILIVLGALAVLAAGGWGMVFAPQGPAGTEPIHFVVEEGASLQAVAQDLKGVGLVRNAWTLRVWARLTGRERAVRCVRPSGETGRRLRSRSPSPCRVCRITIACLRCGRC